MIWDTMGTRDIDKTHKISLAYSTKHKTTKSERR